MVMPRQMLIDAVRGRAPIIRGEHIRDDQFQPATMDMRLGPTIHAVSTSFLPPGSHDSILDLVKRLSHYNFELSQDKTHHLDVNKIYMVPLMEHCEFPENTRMFFSPKSSVGRNDVHVRVVAEGYPYYDRTPFGYKGPLWVQIAPQSFHVGVRAELALVQGRIKTRDSHRLTTDEIYHMHEKYGIAYDSSGKVLSPNGQVKVHEGTMHFHIDLERDVVGFKAKRNVGKQLDLSAEPNTYDPKEFWEPLYRQPDGCLVLDSGEFYLLATQERVSIPPECCGELLPVDPSLGEFRVHYAGFFDNGFGGKNGTHGVLEVRSSGRPFMMQHGKPVRSMAFERTFEIPDQLYGAGGSSYTEPHPSLSKHFLRRYDSWTLKHQASRF